MATYWGGWGSCCCSSCSPVTFCIKACSGAISLDGAVVTVSSGGTTIGSCTTGSTGCCQITIPSAGTYTVTVVFQGGTLTSGSRSLTCGATVTIAVPVGNFVCCGGYLIPYNLTGTDATGTFPMKYVGIITYPTWAGCVLISRLSCAVTTPGGICVSASPITQTMLVCYRMFCEAGSSPLMYIERDWSWVYQSGTLTPTWYSAVNQGFPSCTAGLSSLCNTAPPGSCGSPLTDDATATANPSSAVPFAVSFGSLTPSPANQTTDPIGGTVSVSA